MLGLGVESAAAATVISQGLSLLMMVIFVKRKISVYRLRRSEFRVNIKYLKMIIKIGFPQMCQFVLTQISFNMISSVINAYGTAHTAAAGAANRMYSIGVMIGQAVMASILTLTAQNLPRANYNRIYKGLGSGIALSLIAGAVLMLVCEIVPGPFLSIFTQDAMVIEVGIPFLRLLVWAFMIENVMFCFFGLLTGAGYTLVTMACALVTAFAVRYVACLILSNEAILGFNGIAVAYILAPVVALIIAGLFTASGRWKRAR